MLYQNLDGNPQMKLDKNAQTQAHQKLRLSVLAVAVASVTSTNVFAANESETTTMETVVVTGSIIGNSELEDVKEYPGARTVLTHEQIKKLAHFLLIKRFKVYLVLKSKTKLAQVFYLTFQCVV